MLWNFERSGSDAKAPQRRPTVCHCKPNARNKIFQNRIINVYDPVSMYMTAIRDLRASLSNVSKLALTRTDRKTGKELYVILPIHTRPRAPCSLL